jgi:hypothetical protein
MLPDWMIGDPETDAQAMKDNPDWKPPRWKVRAQQQQQQQSNGHAPPTVSPSENPNYVKKAVSGELASLGATSDGARNDTLNSVALRCARLLPFDPDAREWLRQRLIDACEANGYIRSDGLAKTEATIRSAFDAADRLGPATDVPLKVPAPKGDAEPFRPPSTHTRQLVVTRASEVEMRPIEWWEPGLVVKDSLNLLAGRENTGKTTIITSWTARETRDGGTVLWIGTEEPRESAQTPRLAAAGAKLDRVIFIDAQIENTTATPIFPLDLPKVRQVIAEHNVTMIVLDPCKGVVPVGFSGNDDIAVRQFLEPLHQLATDCRVVVLGLVHFGKRDSADTGKLILGSSAWSQVPRSVLSVAEEAGTGCRVMTNTKANFAKESRSVEFRIVGKIVETPHGSTEMGVVEWLGDTTKDARDFLGEPVRDDDADDVDEWLKGYLKGGPKTANDVFSAADAAGYSKDKAKRAKPRTCVHSYRPGGKGPWYWSIDPLCSGCGEPVTCGQGEAHLNCQPQGAEA